MTDQEQIEACAKYLKERTKLAAELLEDARGILDCVVWEIHLKESGIDDACLDPNYHLQLTITVAEARKAITLQSRLDHLFRVACKASGQE